MTPILSVLIPTTPERRDMFDPLFSELMRQDTYMSTFHSSLGEIEILVDDEKKFLDGGPSIGEKCNNLVQRATGKYLCRLDSDDWIAPNYLETIVRLCQFNSDIVTFNSLVKTEGYWTVVSMRHNYIYGNEEATPGKTVNREPWPCCPIRSELAKQFKFENINYGEDWNWMKQVLNVCQSSEYTTYILHEYRHGAHSEADKIINAGHK
jgi:hypothetical protein